VVVHAVARARVPKKMKRKQYQLAWLNQTAGRSSQTCTKLQK
jgi:hypothetical protein